MEFRENVGEACSLRELREVKVARVSCCDNGSIGQLDTYRGVGAEWLNVKEMNGVVGGDVVATCTSVSV